MTDIPPQQHVIEESNFNINADPISNKSSCSIKTPLPFSSPSSSVYSSSEKGCTPANYDLLNNTNASVRSISSSLLQGESRSAHKNGNNASLTSVRNIKGRDLSYQNAHQPHYHQNDSEQWSQYSSASTTSSFLKSIRSHNPFRWLLRRSDSRSGLMTRKFALQHRQKMQQSKETVAERERQSLADGEKQIENLRFEKNGHSVIGLAEKLEMLEGKIDYLCSLPAFGMPGINPSRFSSPGKGPSKETKGAEKNAGVQTDPEILYQCHIESDEGKQQKQAMTTRARHLTNMNTNLSSLNALLSSDLCRLRNTIQDLQAELCVTRRTNTVLEKRLGSYEERKVHIDLQIRVIQQLGRLLGRKEEQLRLEEKKMEMYTDKLNGLEDGIEKLRIELKNILPAKLQVKNPLVDN
ncbi:hypothetical protein BGW36DRAFT_424954 [Talaromyces proteolyticus]|uniref:Uncharacterized protein n=1 Tax=Talaromyces proteolyticus TaxID=1131652 RepID=A0AAD4Q251_9EURO|nr:uncharacterized protein BGW36DRAFT_424954 [Talaromyces proteolyticus]KAH8700117.1 hypothetical protein BGW36DRAFT_424954 [Talaromyces proteolyticus]